MCFIRQWFLGWWREKRKLCFRQENIKVIKHVLKYRLSIGLLGSFGLNLQLAVFCARWQRVRVGILFMGSCLQIWKWTGKKKSTITAAHHQRKVESIWVGQMFYFGCFKREKIVWGDVCSNFERNLFWLNLCLEFGLLEIIVAELCAKTFVNFFIRLKLCILQGIL